MITNQQKQRIHHLAHKIGIIIKDEQGRANDTAYRGLLHRWYTVKSCLDLSETMADNCIKRLTFIAQKMGVWEIYKDNRTKYNDLGYRSGYATPAQLRMIEAMWVDVSYQQTIEAKQNALRRFLLSHYRISNLRWLDIRDVSKIIETLEEMAKKEKGQRLQYTMKRSNGLSKVTAPREAICGG